MRHKYNVYKNNTVLQKENEKKSKIHNQIHIHDFEKGGPHN